MITEEMHLDSPCRCSSCTRNIIYSFLQKRSVCVWWSEGENWFLVSFVCSVLFFFESLQQLTADTVSPMQRIKLSVEFLRQITYHTHIHKHTVQKYRYAAENMTFYHCRKMKCRAYQMLSEANRNYTSDHKQLSALQPQSSHAV